MKMKLLIPYLINLNQSENKMIYNTCKHKAEIKDGDLLTLKQRHHHI